jgi:hypothetical protein
MTILQTIRASDRREVRPVQFDLPCELIDRIDRLAGRELLSRASWLRREIVLAVRANDHIEKTEAKVNA